MDGVGGDGAGGGEEKERSVNRLMDLYFGKCTPAEVRERTSRERTGGGPGSMLGDHRLCGSTGERRRGLDQNGNALAETSRRIGEISRGCRD